MKSLLIILITVFAVQTTYASEGAELKTLIPADQLTFTLDIEDIEADINFDIQFDDADESNEVIALGHRRGRDRYRPRPRPRRQVVCKASPRRGRRVHRVFRARGRRPYRVQQRAVAKCERRTGRYCVELGCYRVRGRR